MSSAKSVVEYFGRQKVNYCGYCRTKKGHDDYGMWLHHLTVTDYQSLIDRGWRRSGLYGYKPLMVGACCALYTIRCEALKLKLTRSQKKLIKRFNRFIVYGERRKCHAGESGSRGHEETASQSAVVPKSTAKLENIGTEVPTPSCSMQPTFENKTEASNAADEVAIEQSSARKPTKKKTIRFERAKKRVMAKGHTEAEAIEILKLKRKIPKSKTVEEFLMECEKQNTKHRLEVKFVRSSPSNDEFERTFDVEYAVYRKYQVVIHNDDPEECSPKQFRRFLVTSPLQPRDLNVSNAPVAAFGSYHQQYWLDGKLIAVGVIDVLPHCVSSVYFFYDPDYNDLVLGTYGSMKELQLVRELQRFVPSVQYYYMGFYIHTCPKMRYKARITPSYLLCPETYTFQPTKACLEKIITYGVCRLHPDPEASDENSVESIGNIMVFNGERTMSYENFRLLYCTTDEDEVAEFARAIGKKCANSIRLYRHTV